MKKGVFAFIFMKKRLFQAGILYCVFVSAIALGLSESTGPGGSNAQAVHALGYEGQGINIGFISQDNLYVSHEAFYEKDSNSLPTGPQHAFVHDVLGFGINATDHDTQMAGIIVSNGGQGYPDQIGVAPKANLHNVRVVSDGQISPADIEDALDELIINQNCKVIVTGIALSSVSAPPDGDSLWTKIYDYYAQQHDVVFANAAGNFESNVNVFGDAYNGITTGGLFVDANDIYHQVGAINGSGSNSGPTVDGRKKPEIVCPSQDQWTPKADSDSSWGHPPSYYHDRGQTSWSVPHTAGVAALLLGYAEETTPEPDDSKSEVIKAVIVNSTFPNILDKDGNNTVYLPEDPNKVRVWDTDRGHGRIDALRAFETLSENRIAKNSSSPQQKGWASESIRRNQTHTYRITGQKNQRLLVTVTWHRKLDSSFDEEVPRFYVDLEVMSLSSGSTVVSKTAESDNLIKIDVLLEQDGDYEIVINNAPQISFRNYAMAFELLDPLPGDVHVDYVVDISDLIDLAFYWLDSDCTNPTQDCYGVNLSPNGPIDLSDFSVLGENWLTYDSRYYSP